MTFWILCAVLLGFAAAKYGGLGAGVPAASQPSTTPQSVTAPPTLPAPTLPAPTLPAPTLPARPSLPEVEAKPDCPHHLDWIHAGAIHHSAVTNKRVLAKLLGCKP